MEVAEADEFEIDKAGPGFAETQKRATPGIDEHPGASVHPDDVAGRRPAVVRDRPARAQHLQGNTVGGRALLCRRCMSHRRDRQGKYEQQQACRVSHGSGLSPTCA
jgi:hypothetical protein